MRPARFDNLRSATHGIWSDGGMRDDDMARCKRSAELLNGLHQRVIIRNKNLEVIAHFRQLRGRTDEVWNRTRGTVPDEDLKSFLAQIGGHATADNPEADDSDIFSHWSEHVTLGSSGRSIRSRSKCGQKRRQATQKFASLRST